MSLRYRALLRPDPITAYRPVFPPEGRQFRIVKSFQNFPRWNDDAYSHIDCLCFCCCGRKRDIPMPCTSPNRCAPPSPDIAVRVPAAVCMGVFTVLRTNAGDPLNPPIERPSTRYASISPKPSIGNLSFGIIAMLPVRTMGVSVVLPKKAVKSDM